MTEFEQLYSAFNQAKADLLAERTPSGHWEGELSSSPLSTATAISALVLAEQHGDKIGQEYMVEAAYQGDLSELVVHSLHWLAERQNDDGGWGDTEQSKSNIATTMLVSAAFHLTGVPVKFAHLLEHAQAYIDQQGGIAGLRRRYGRDKTFAAPILTNCALADLVSWREVPSLPFEMAALPQGFYRFARMPVVSYAIPALVAIGQAKYFHRKPWNPISRLARKLSVAKTLNVLSEMQPPSGGYLEATPLTSFVVMSLASIGQADHVVVRRGVEFLLSSVRPDGSWPIDTNLATWNTTLAMSALERDADSSADSSGEADCLDWLLECQHRERHPFTGAEPGGWAWTDLSGGVPDADDTAGALIVLRAQRDRVSLPRREEITSAARQGVGWLLGLQNSDGGFPTFCRGWGKLPFDRSGCDLTAHAIRALFAWRRMLCGRARGATPEVRQTVDRLDARIEQSIEQGLAYLAIQQREDGSWTPLWFGNQHLPEEENPIYGTARVLLAYRDLGRLAGDEAQAGLRYLAKTQQPDGGWGGGPAAAEAGFPAQGSTVEETALATEALLSAIEGPLEVAAGQGVAWLVRAVQDGRHTESSPIGLYFAKLWYHERLYPLVHTVSALGSALALQRRQPELAAHLSRT
jgi:squalene-hopene/tetraprenyl-beta-curcumene cyclase